MNGRCGGGEYLCLLLCYLFSLSRGAHTGMERRDAIQLISYNSARGALASSFCSSVSASVFMISGRPKARPSLLEGKEGMGAVGVVRVMLIRVFFPLAIS